MPHTFSLPITLRPQADELLGAFLARTASENIFSSSQLCQVLRTVAYGTKHDPTGCDEKEAFLRMLRTLGNPDLAEQPMRTSDLALRLWSERSFKQICPACLAEGMTITHGLAEKCWAMCVTHRLIHLTHCPHCQVRLTWARGSYSQCECGYDLRFAPRITTSSALADFLIAIAYDVSPEVATNHSASAVLDIGAARARLRSTFAYFAGGLKIAVSGIPTRSSNATSPMMRLWQEIFQDCHATGGLEAVIQAIETRVKLVGWPRSTLSVRQANSRRIQITWKHLSSLATLASAPVELREDCKSDLPSRLEVSLEAKDAIRGISDRALSAAVKSKLERQIAMTWKTPDLPVETVRSRIASILDCARDLRHFREPDWIRPAFLDPAEIMSLIAIGILTPFEQTFVPSWHIRASDVATVALKMKVLPCTPQEVGRGHACGYTLRHCAIFDGRASIAEWLSLSKEDATKKIEALVPDWETCFASEGQGITELWGLRLPFGFAYFLDTTSVGRFAVDASTPISNSYLVTCDESKLRDCLVQTWESALARVQELSGWAMDSARASQHVLGSRANKGNVFLGPRATEASTGYQTPVGHQG